MDKYVHIEIRYRRELEEIPCIMNRSCSVKLQDGFQFELTEDLEKNLEAHAEWAIWN
jgi:hypothetical protein